MDLKLTNILYVENFYTSHPSVVVKAKSETAVYFLHTTS